MSELVFEILRQSLAAGEEVEIEGLGTFRRAASGFEFTPAAEPRVFIGYAVEDLPLARRLAEDLRKAGCAPWLDKDQLLPGQNWPRAIRRAIDTSDAFIACFSKRSIEKRGQFQTELRQAIASARRLPLDQVFLIPVRLDRCAIPAGISSEVQYVDLFGDWDRGVKRILKVIRNTVRRSLGPAVLLPNN